MESVIKQFFLESDRLRLTYRSLEEQFKSTQKTLQDAQSQLYGKLAELDFVTSYLESILSHISQGILFIDLNGIVTTYNAAAEEIFTIPASKILLHSFTDFFPDELLGFSLKEALMSKQCPKTTFITWSEKEIEIDTTFVGMSAHICPIAFKQSSAISVQGLLILARNITEYRRLQTIANRHDRLKDLGELSARMAHEIRNPLGGIKGFASLLQQDLQDRPELQQMAAQIVEGTDHLSHFVSNILNYARPLQTHFESIDLVVFLQEMIQLIQADQGFNQQVQCNFKSSEATLIVPIDLQLMKSALLNLFVNAGQAMPQGGLLSVDLKKSGDYALIKVEDTGIGIPKENLDKIFSPFFTTKESGTGLGLSEAYKVIQVHNGVIEVNSKVGHGTEFSIKLPYTQIK